MFTDASIKRLPSRATAYRHFEGGALPGFHLQIQPSGTKTFYLQVTRHDQRRFYRIGVYPAMPLAAAREQARELLSRIEQGVDPRMPTPVVAQGTVNDLILAWLSHQAGKGRRRLDIVEVRLRHDLPNALLEKPAAAVTATDIQAVLAGIHQRGSRAMAARVQMWLRTLFQYGLRADHDPRRLDAPALFGLHLNPVDAIPVDSAASRLRDRSLSWAEVRRLWHDDTLSWAGRQVCKLLLVTGARVNEIAQAAWSEFDLSAQIWTLPVARSKNKRELWTPLTPLMLELLHETRAVWPNSRWLFPSRHPLKDQPFCETAVGKLVRLHCRAVGWEPWQPRDLRRTFKTLAGEIGLSLEIRNRIQGHALTDVGSRHYDRYAYQHEKRAALLAWEGELRARVAVKTS
jgi:integrase